MANLSSLEKRAFEDLFGMQTGYVLDFSNRTFAEFFRDNAKIDIFDRSYELNGSSKANRLRTFWDQAPDKLVGWVLEAMLELWEYSQDGDVSKNKKYTKCLATVAKLSGKPPEQIYGDTKFMDRKIDLPNLALLKLDPAVTQIIEARLAEVELGLKSGASLSVIFMCGSILEGVLLGTAVSHPDKFNRSTASPKDDNGKVLPFHKWSLAQFIDVTCDIGFLDLDVKKFSHALRDFRNYIHPYEQMASQFAPDKHTADICFQVLKAALADLSKSS